MWSLLDFIYSVGGGAMRYMYQGSEYKGASGIMNVLNAY